MTVSCLLLGAAVSVCAQLSHALSVDCAADNECEGDLITIPSGTAFHMYCSGYRSCRNVKLVVESGCTMDGDINCEPDTESCRYMEIEVYNSDLTSTAEKLDCYDSAGVDLCDDMIITLVSSSLRIECSEGDCDRMTVYLYDSELIIDADSAPFEDGNMQIHSDGSSVVTDETGSMDPYIDVIYTTAKPTSTRTLTSTKTLTTTVLATTTSRVATTTKRELTSTTKTPTTTTRVPTTSKALPTTTRRPLTTSKAPITSTALPTTTPLATTTPPITTLPTTTESVVESTQKLTTAVANSTKKATAVSTDSSETIESTATDIETSAESTLATFGFTESTATTQPTSTGGSQGSGGGSDWLVVAAVSAASFCFCALCAYYWLRYKPSKVLKKNVAEVNQIDVDQLHTDVVKAQAY